MFSSFTFFPNDPQSRKSSVQMDCENKIKNLVKSYKHGTVITNPHLFVKELDRTRECDVFYPKMKELRESFNLHLKDDDNVRKTIEAHKSYTKEILREYVSFWDYLWL